MVPHDLINYFTASAAVSGSLVGLLFVAISLRGVARPGLDTPTPRGR